MLAYAKQLLARHQVTENSTQQSEATALSNRVCLPKLERTILQRHAAERVLNDGLKKKSAGAMLR